MFRTIVADPPWLFGDALPGKARGASKNYRCLTPTEIVEVMAPYAQAAEFDCRLFLWRVASMQEEALWVAGRLGFKTKSEMVWLKLSKNGKPHFGMGRQVRNSHESVLIATRGRPERLSASIRSTFTAPYTGAHSGKPEAFFDIVEALSPGPLLELFARRHRPGWTCVGDQLEPVITVAATG